MTTTRTDLDTAPAVLDFARASLAAADRAEAGLLLAATTWAEQHPPESIALAATWPGTEGELTLAGEGAPSVAEFCIAEFAAAIGRSTDSGRALIAHGLELKHRLPRTQRRVDRAGERDGLSPWKARRIAEATLGLSAEAAAFVDVQAAPFAHRIGPAQLDRLVAEAIARFTPDQAVQNAAQAAERRHVTFHHEQVSFDGTTFVEAELDLADALDLALDLERWSSSERSVETTHHPRQVVLHVHLSEAAITGHTKGELHLARVENHRRGVTADQVKGWCANPDTHVIVKPVIDLADHIHVNAYEVPDRLREQTELLDDTRVFPWCIRRRRPACHTRTGERAFWQS